MLNPLKEKIYCVRGNCDTEVDQMVLEFPILADFGVLSWEGRWLYVTHGHKYNRKEPMALAPGDILLHGHTHIPAWEHFGDKNRYWNPGSVSIPKEGSAHGYMILEGGTALWKDLDGTVYHRENL